MKRDRKAIMQLFAVIRGLNPDTSLDKDGSGWRLQTIDGGSNLSPRLDTSSFYWWLYGYESGLRKAQEPPQQKPTIKERVEALVRLTNLTPGVALAQVLREERSK